MSRSPIVLVGPLRGGTTLLRLLLSHHPEIEAVGEFEEAVSQAGDSGWPDASWFRQWLNQDRVARSQEYQLPPGLDDYPSLVRSMWDQLVSRQGGAPVCLCTIHSRFDRVREIWPDARFIFQIRDPRDVARSCVQMGWVGEPTSGAATWIDPARRWLKLRKELAADDFLEIKFEELLKDPERELGRCCDFVGLPFDPAMLEIESTTTYSRIDPGYAERWRTNLTARQSELIELQCGGLMGAFGYEPSATEPKTPGTIERLSLKLKNRLGRYGFRIKRYGLRLTLGWTVVQHLSLNNSARRVVRLRLNEIDTRHLK